RGSMATIGRRPADRQAREDDADSATRGPGRAGAADIERQDSGARGDRDRRLTLLSLTSTCHWPGRVGRSKLGAGGPSMPARTRVIAGMLAAALLGGCNPLSSFAP